MPIEKLRVLTVIVIVDIHIIVFHLNTQIFSNFDKLNFKSTLNTNIVLSCHDYRQQRD